MHRQEPQFDRPVIAWAATGATLGVVMVLTAAAVLIVLSDSGIDLMAVAALAAGFGGTGFGAMMGAVLASLREPTVDVVSTRDRVSAARRPSSPS